MMCDSLERKVSLHISHNARVSHDVHTTFACYTLAVVVVPCGPTWPKKKIRQKKRGVKLLSCWIRDVFCLPPAPKVLGSDSKNTSRIQMLRHFDPYRAIYWPPEEVVAHGRADSYLGSQIGHSIVSGAYC